MSVIMKNIRHLRNNTLQPVESYPTFRRDIFAYVILHAAFMIRLLYNPENGSEMLL
jgi:hypothetical protein